MSDPIPPPKYVQYGLWAEHAPTVEKMVQKGWGVSDAVRQVVANHRFKDPDHAFRGIRAAVYELRKRRLREAGASKQSDAKEFKI